MHKWDWLEDRIRKCGFKNRRQFCLAINWNDARVSDMVNGRLINKGQIPNFPKEKLILVSELLHIDLKSLIRYNNGEISDVVFDEDPVPTISQIRIPYLNLASTAESGYYNDIEYIDSYFTVSSGKFINSLGNFKKPAVIIVKGNSMHSTLNDGDLVLVDSAATEFIEGKVFVVMINNELFIKRLFRNPSSGNIICSSDNPKYPPFEIKKEELQIKAILLKTFKNIDDN